MKKVLIIAPLKISDNMTGPAIRYLEFSKHLANFFEVILLCNDFNSNSFFGINHRKLSLKNIIRFSKKCDFIILQGLTLWKYPIIKYLKKPIVVDLYDPFHLENLEIYEDNPLGNLMYKTTVTVLEEQIYHGSYFICASEKQKDYWLGLLTLLGKINITNYKIDRTFSDFFGVVPFGLPVNKPIKTKNVLKGVVNEIKNTDYVVLWGGGIWDWLDPETLLHAMRIIKNKRNDIKCFFMGVKPFGKSSSKLDNLMELKNKLDLNDTVIFNDWVKYEERHEYLLEADIGISLHFNHLETRYAFRTRILDYIWCELPIISTKGDVLSEIIKEQKCGITVSEKNAIELADAIIEIINYREKYTCFNNLQKEYSWANVIQDIVSYGNKTQTNARRINYMKEIKWYLYRVLYYSIRLIDRITFQFK